MSTVKEMNRALSMKELDRVVGGELFREGEKLIAIWTEQDNENGSDEEEEMNTWILMADPEAAEYVNQRWDITSEGQLPLR